MNQPTLQEQRAPRNSGQAPASQRSAPVDWIDALAAAHRPGYSLAQPFYNNAEIFQRDFERIFLKQWVFAGHVSRVRNAGDYFLFTIAGESIIIIRGKDGNLHAHFNVCRHRGSRICRETSGTKQTLVCPYHAWTYAADGQLLSAPAMPEDFKAAEHSLHKCHVRVVAGLIFIHLGAVPPDRENIFRDWEQFFQPYAMADAKIAASLTWQVNANWKLVIENFDECYHCGPAHPEYCSVMAHAVPDTHRAQRDVAAFAQFRATWEAENLRRGQPTGHVSHDTDVASVCARNPIRPGFLTQSRDGQPVAPLLGELQEYDGGWTYAGLWPNNYCLAFPDHIVIPRFTPLAPQLTEVEMIWLVRPDATEVTDYQTDNLTWLWRVTTEQDKRIVDDNQAGVNSVAYRPGPYSNTEAGLVHFTTWYVKQLVPAR